MPICQTCEIEEAVGEWDDCYECARESYPFPICPRCYSKIYDDVCGNCYDDFKTCNICNSDENEVNPLNICYECVSSRKQECVNFINNVLNLCGEHKIVE